MENQRYVLIIGMVMNELDDFDCHRSIVKVYRNENGQRYHNELIRERRERSKSDKQSIPMCGN